MNTTNPQAGSQEKSSERRADGDVLSKTGHTLGRLRVRDIGDDSCGHRYEIRDGDDPVADIFYTTERGREHAERIVAACNALIGIDDPAAFRAEFEAMREALRDTIRMCERRDDPASVTLDNIESFLRDILANANQATGGAQ